MAVFASAKFSEESFRQADALFAKLPLEVRNRVVEPSLRAAAVPAVRKMRQLAPDSHKTGSWSKWSRKVLAKRGGAKQHKDTIGTSSIRRYGDTTALYVGPIHPQGNLINIIGHPRRQVLWGKPTGKVVPPTRYLQEAAEQTAAQQEAAFVNKAKSETEKLLKQP